MTARMENAMSEQEEDELLCTKLLGLVRMGRGDWRRSTDSPRSYEVLRTPTFRTGDGMLMLLEALRALDLTPSLENNGGKWDCFGGDPYGKWFHAYAASAPAAIRAAALAYIRSRS